MAKAFIFYQRLGILIIQVVLPYKSNTGYRQSIIIFQVQTRYQMSSTKKGWEVSEDYQLRKLMAEHQGKLKWVQVARMMHQATGHQRSGKQCRERWQHQLDPTISHGQWSHEECLLLFNLQKTIGNKWALIAQRIQGRTDNGAKNFFYSALRRAFTKVNGYLGRRRHTLRELKSIRNFQAQFMSKLMAVADGNYDKKIRITDGKCVNLARAVVERLTRLYFSLDILEHQNANSQMDELLIMMQEFRKSCKKRKQEKCQLEASSEQQQPINHCQEYQSRQERQNQDIQPFLNGNQVKFFQPMIEESQPSREAGVVREKTPILRLVSIRSDLPNILQILDHEQSSDLFPSKFDFFQMEPEQVSVQTDGCTSPKNILESSLNYNLSQFGLQCSGMNQPSGRLFGGFWQANLWN